MQIRLEEYKNGYVHFIGCGGVGTQPLMKIFHELGFQCSGSDMARSAATDALAEMGLKVHIGHSAANLPPDDGSKLLVVYTSAASNENPELLEARRRGAICIKRGEALGLLTQCFRRVIAVSGSHGKTTVTGMITHTLKELGLNPGYLIGGSISGWESNGAAGNGDIFVCEADESDGTHTEVHPYVAVVTNVEDDHVWNFAGMDVLLGNFRSFAFGGKKLIYVEGGIQDELFATHPSAVRLGKDEDRKPGTLDGFCDTTISEWGKYQRINALTAVEAVVSLGGIDRNKAKKELGNFPGVERRMSLRFQDSRFKVIEDYAHHPTELRASISAMRETHPGRRLVVIFQPHRYARLKKYFNEFAVELSKADAIYITPVFSAWTKSEELNSVDLASKIGEKARFVEGTWKEIALRIRTDLSGGELIAVIGAGDLKEILPPLISELRI